MKTPNSGVKIAAVSALLGAAAALADPNQPIPLSNGWQLQDASQVPQEGAVISSAGFQPQGWHPATVPGTVLTSLVNDGTYPEPLYGENNRKIPDTLCRTTWWYRTVFAPPPAGAGQRTWLNFDGVNYIAEVWLNGRELGTLKGAFVRGTFDVTSTLVAGASNVLAVHIWPQPHPGRT
jgi:beta-galactosidase/beta-glucuronidase